MEFWVQTQVRKCYIIAVFCPSRWPVLRKHSTAEYSVLLTWMSRILAQLEGNVMQNLLHLKKSVCVLEWREDRLVKRSCLSGAFETEHGIQDHSCDVDWQGIPVCDGDGISDGVITAHTDPWRVCQLLHQPVIASCFTRAHRPNTGPCIYTRDRN